MNKSCLLWHTAAHSADPFTANYVLCALYSDFRHNFIQVSSLNSTRKILMYKGQTEIRTLKASHHESILQICITEVHTDVAQLAHVLFFPEQFKSVEVQLLFLWIFTFSKYSFRFALIAEDVLNIIYKVNTKIKRRAGKFIPKQQFQGWKMKSI